MAFNSRIHNDHSVRRFDQLIFKPLMIPLCVVMLCVLLNQMLEIGRPESFAICP